MKKTLVMTAALLALTASLAAAAGGGLNLSWNDCGASGDQDHFFACNTNTTNNLLPGHTFVASYVAPCCVDSANGTAAVISLRTSGAVLPDWWRFAVTPCNRSTSLAENYNTSLLPGGCLDYWGQQTGGAATGGRSYTIPDPGLGAPSARLNLACAIPTTVAGPIAEGTEVYMASVKISNQKTVGLGRCLGCDESACIVLNSIKITQNQRSTGGTKFIGNPANRNWITWRGGLANCGDPVTPARNTTWGSVKALYR